ncbi:MAG TPA: DEAD/DEAH box helicase family protein [Ktedonobacteraceae bacterium]|nr:DEAD/DEAH box helicase family protein [Ktedonobacteraceae bacterium]
MSSEAEVRQKLIDKQLAIAGWSSERGNLRTEIFILGTRRQIKEAAEDYVPPQRFSPAQDHPPPQRDGFADYALIGSDGSILAVVEAKRDTRSPLEGMEQAAEYVRNIYHQTGKQPFIFLGNGDELYFWELDRYPPRKVSGFYTVRDLEDLALTRLYSQPLHLFRPDPAIIERDYQIQAIQTVIDGIKQKKRKFLLVMATGTGKTRTVIALVGLLIRAGWVRRALFLADRRELVRQAELAFEAHLPDESRVRIEGGVIGEGVDARIHFATYPSMIQVLSKLSVGYYDLIIADESHRSIYKHYKAIFEYFDAMQIGLTATPTDYIEHNTFALFDCFDDFPTFDYPFETAVENDYLVSFRVLAARTRFQIEGIKAGELPPELQRQIEEQGLELSEINFEGSDLERKVTNTGTNDALVDEFMERCYKDARGLPQKSIIFAVSHNHALELLASFNRRYPDLQAHGMAKVIDSRMERAEQSLADFKEKDMPRVAISVDMLDAGIDVPAIQTLVFAKPVYSQVKFWQMVGRGTRLWTDPVTQERKNDFVIIDHWENFKTFERNPEGKVSHPSEPLPVRLFRIRLQKLAVLRSHNDPFMLEATLKQLHEMLADLPETNVQVRAYATDLVTFRDDPTWIKQDISPTGKLYRFIAPLMSFLPGVDAATLLFELHTEQLLLSYLQGQQEQVVRLKEQIKDELARLPRDLPEVRAKAHMRTWVESPDFWTHLSGQRILDMQKELAPVMRYREARPRSIVKLHLPDSMKQRLWITYGPAGEGTFVEDYQEQVEVRVKDLAEQVSTLAKIKRNGRPDESEMQSLADLLNKPDLFIREEILKQVYGNPDMRLLDFIKHILDVEHLPNKKERVTAAVQRFLHEHPHFSPIQRRFVFALQSVLLHEDGGQQQQGVFTPDYLLQAPFNRIGKANDLFNAHDLADLLQFANSQVA